MCYTWQPSVLCRKILQRKKSKKCTMDAEQKISNTDDMPIIVDDVDQLSNSQQVNVENNLSIESANAKLFRKLTGREFSNELEIYVFDNGTYDFVREPLPFSFPQHGKYGANDITKLFQCCGSVLFEISIINHNFGQLDPEQTTAVLDLVAEHCGDNLKSLKIHSAKISEALAVKLRPILKGVQVLHWVGIEVLHLIDLQNDASILENTFFKLQEFDYCQSHSNLESVQLLPSFISRHTRLKVLNLISIARDETCERNILEEIGNNCRELEQLLVNMRVTNTSYLQPLQALQSLKTLRLWNMACKDLTFISALSNLRVLSLGNCDLPNDYSQFNFMVQLKELYLVTSKKNASTLDVVDVVRRLINLEKITVGDGYCVLDVESFSKIVEIVKRRPNVLMLKCKFNFVFDAKNWNENQRVRLIKPTY